ncbi:hypothetical protein PG995_005371 [Apiospora arundinis]
MLVSVDFLQQTSLLTYAQHSPPVARLAGLCGGTIPSLWTLHASLFDEVTRFVAWFHSLMSLILDPESYKTSNPEGDVPARASVEGATALGRSEPLWMSCLSYAALSLRQQLGTMTKSIRLEAVYLVTRTSKQLH